MCRICYWTGRRSLPAFCRVDEMPFDGVIETESSAGFLIVDLPQDAEVGFMDESRILKYADELDEAFEALEAA